MCIIFHSLILLQFFCMIFIWISYLVLFFCASNGFTGTIKEEIFLFYNETKPGSGMMSIIQDREIPGNFSLEYIKGTFNNISDLNSWKSSSSN